MANFLFDNATNKQGLIVYGGEASADYGIVVGDAPSFEKPKRRTTVYPVQGRNGSVIFQDGSYDDVARTYKIWLPRDAKDNLPDMVHAVSAWLYSKTGYQRLEDSFEPDVYRLAYYEGGQEFTNEMMQYGKATLRFMCRAERFYKNAETPVVVSDGSLLHNPTRFASKPLIHIVGSGDVTVTIGGKTLTATITDYIDIDCDSMNAYREEVNRNSYVSGTFPTIETGDNTVSTTGTITEMTIVPRYFTI